jgi:hypothetical protein
MRKKTQIANLKKDLEKLTAIVSHLAITQQRQQQPLKTTEKPSKKPRKVLNHQTKKNPNNPARHLENWTEAETTICFDLRKAGWEYQAIGKYVGRTSAAVQHRLSSLGLLA